MFSLFTSRLPYIGPRGGEYFKGRSTGVDPPPLLAQVGAPRCGNPNVASTAPTKKGVIITYAIVVPSNKLGRSTIAWVW